MKHRKLFALLMALVMLLGMVPAGHAEGGNMMPGGEVTVSCNHNWSWRWPNGKPANCKDWKMSEEYCTKCGAVGQRYEQCGACRPGSWHWDGNPPADCTEWGIQNLSCAVCGEVFDERNAQGSHKWGGYATDTPAGCETPGEKSIRCTVCGQKGKIQEIPPTGHDWGKWVWDGEPSCTEGGWQHRTCNRCKHREDKEIPAGTHQWGRWEDHTLPTCTERGSQYIKCSRCGATEWRHTDVIDHLFGEWYVVTEPQVGVPGLEQRDCTYGCGTFEQREIPALSEGDNIPPAVELPTVVLEKHVMNTPANGEFFVPGEAIQFGLTLWVYGPGRDKASSEFIVNEAAIFDPLKEEPVVVVDMGGTWNMGNAFLYTVTEEDALRGYVENTGYATWVYVENGQPGRVDSNTVTTPCGAGPLSADGLSLTLALSSTPANGTHFVVGEEVTFTETWSNGTGKTLYPFSVSIWTCGAPVFGSEIDQICSWFAEDAGGPVAPGASGSHTLTVTVTEADVARGEIYAMAELLSTVQGGADLENVTTPFVTAPCGPDNSGDFGLVNGLTVTKKVTSTPANGSYYEPGEDITFVITVSNQGVEPLLNVNVIDPLGGGLVTVLETLNAGETRDITVVFTTTDIVAWAGSVDNGACVKAVDKDGRQYVEYSNIVTVPCGHTFLNVTITPPFGIFHSLAVIKKEESLPLNGEYYTEGEVIHYSITYTNDGELPLTDVQIWDVLDVTTPVASAEMLNPGESRICYYQHTVTAEDVAAGTVMNIAHASYPVPNYAGFANSTSNVVISKTSADEKGDTPPFGTIDTDSLHGDDNYCVRTITGRDNVSATYETDFCSVHTPIQASALMMKQAAVTPETQMQAAAYAVALWRTEVEKLYQEIFKAADPTAKTVVMTEYIRFLTEVANYETMLKVLYPDQPALVALKVADIWENKCVDLCYDAHAAAAERKDSLLAVTPAAGASAAECTCVTTAETNGQKTDVQSYCPAHSFPFGMIDMLLQGNDTAESWTMVRQIWGVELTSAYNKLYTALGDNKLLAMAEYNALTQWMMAREATLIALYPDHPEIAAQIMVKTIMERVNALCSAVK